MSAVKDAYYSDPTPTQPTIDAERAAGIQQAIAFQKAWADHAPELASWALERVFVRTDRFGGYFLDEEKQKQTVTRPDKSTPNAVNAKLLEQHFRATNISHVVGAHALTAAGSNSTGKWIGVDIDAHSEADDPERNKKYAEHFFAKLASLGFRALACHWGTGGFHVWTFFSGEVSGAVLHSFAKWLVKDATAAPWNYSADIETFPKQAEVKQGKYGNWLRLPGRHHTKQRFARVFNGTEWIAGEPAVAYILGCTGDAAELIPDEAKPGAKAPPPPPTSNGKPHHDDRDDVFAEFNRRTSLDTVVQWHEAQGHRVTSRSPGRVDFSRAGKDVAGQSFNVMDRDGCVVTYSFSTNAGMPNHVGLTAAQVRCFYETGSCDTAAMKAFATRLRDELGMPRRVRAVPPAAERTVSGSPPRPAFGEAWNDPHRLARLYSDRYRDEAGRSTLIQWRDEYHQWTGAAWSPKPDTDLDAELARHCREVFVADLPARQEEAQAAGEKSKPVSLYTVTTAVKSNVRVNLSGLLNHPDTGIDAPFWLPGTTNGLEPEDVIAAPNGLFTLSDIAEGRGAFSPPTPLFFTPNAIAFPVSQRAPVPATWLRCLQEWFDGDEASIAGLQEWFAYLLSGRTAAHKVLFIVGPRRSGKGSILRVLLELVGAVNVASTTFTALSENFGLENLLGKRVAVIPDARLSGRTDTAALVERLLSISGEDPQSVNRKNRTRITTRLRTRFVLASNEIPRLPDASGAMESRMFILHTPNSWYGREDQSLGEKLAEELPGILHWAAAGWVRFMKQGMRFTSNTKATQYQRELADLSSPVKAFIRQCCELGAAHETEIPVLYSAWVRWNEQQKREVAPENIFGRDIRAALPALRVINKRSALGNRVRSYAGIGLRTERDWGEVDEVERTGTRSNSTYAKQNRDLTDIGCVSPDRVPVRSSDDPDTEQERLAIATESSLA